MTINILRMEYTVEYVECVSKEELRKGEIDFLNNVIKIDKTMAKQTQEQTLLHEIIHAICDLLGYEELNNDEEKVQGLATALHQVLKSQTIISF